MKAFKRQIRHVEMDFGKELLGSLKEFHDAVTSGDTSKLTVRTVRRAEPPPVIKSKDVRAIRARINVSQLLFADVVGVSPQLVRAWEQGQRKPSKLACRLLEEMRLNPKYWQKKAHAR